MLWLSLVAALLACQFALIVTHIPWLDEWQALLIAWQSPDLLSLLNNLSYEGHPPLWYFLLRGAAQFLPIGMVLPAISMTIAFSLQLLILFRAPFPRLERLLLGLGEIVLFELGAVSRSLALGGLLILLVAALWRRRTVWLPIAILPMCDFLFGLVSIIFLAWKLRESKPYWPGILLWATVSIMAGISVIPSADFVPAEAHLSPLIEITDFVQRLGGLLLPFQTFLGRIAWDGMPPLGLGGPLGAVLLIWLWQRFAHDNVQRIFIFALIACCFALSILVYPLHFRHLSVIALTLVAFTWIAPPPGPVETWRWRSWLVLSAACGLATAGFALVRPFDAGPDAAKAIVELPDHGMPLLAFPANRAPALFPYIDREPVEPDQECSHSYVRWNHKSVVRDGRSLNKALYRWARQYGRSYLILENLPKGVSPDIFRPIAPAFRGYDGQRYILGILGPNEPVRPRDYPSCVANKRPFAW